jgi:uncharacterized membrane protein
MMAHQSRSVSMNNISAATAFFSEVLRHTPTFVWAILGALIAIGGLQLREQTLSRTRVLVMTIGLASLSLFGLLAAFRSHWLAWLAWLAGGIAVYFVAAGRQWPRRVRHLAERNAFLVSGSAIPLVTMLSMFVVFYALNVSLTLHPDWKLDRRLALAAGIAYSILPGLLLARARRILASAHASAA